jgi:hypothetical protein
MTITTVHVVYKTHLDVGFTDYASNVTRRYLDEYIPAAIDLADELERRGERAGFAWTTGSWLIREALNHGTDEQRARVDRAIREGKLRWHALPFSTHTELMDSDMMRYALSLSTGLDRRYGRTTVAAKMTDVPGHTLGMVPELARSGVGYLHIGVNPASSVPDVPPVFRWRAPDGSEVIVHYDFGYGSSSDGDPHLVPGMTDALYIAFTNDNLGPPDIDTVIELHTRIRDQFPDAEIVASSLDAFAARLSEVRETLPVVESEIGDTWIHGPASDPILLSGLRRLQALRAAWVLDGALVPGEPEHDRLSDNLLLIAEHTWGEDIKTFLPDYANWAKAEFQAARRVDFINPGVADPAHAFAVQWSAKATHQGHSFSAVEASWGEQRSRVDLALGSLTPARRAVAQQALFPAIRRPPTDAVAIRIGQRVTAGRFTVAVGADGALTELTDRTGRNWAGADNPIGRFSYESFGAAEYDRWLSQYCRDLAETGEWALVDFGKVGLDLADPAAAHSTWTAAVDSIVAWNEGDGAVVRVSATVPGAATEGLGAPRQVEITYRVDDADARVTIELRLRGKDANRLPEASWFTIAPAVPVPEAWTMTKMGVELDPHLVVSRGNRALHSVDSLRNVAHDATITIIPRDSPIVSLGSRSLLEFSDAIPDLAGGFHFNLHNNVWGTNFRMWSEDDTAHDFTIEVSEVTPCGAAFY